MRRVVVCLTLAACSRPGEVDDARSRGLPVASMTAARQASVYEAAIREAFDVEPGLVLFLNPIHLPPGAGLEGGPPVPDSLTDALRSAGIIRGMCDPQRVSDQRAPLCDADRSGYVVQASQIFDGPSDTVYVHLRAEVFAATRGPGQRPFDFEMGYKVVPREGGRWRVVAEGRVGS